MAQSPNISTQPYKGTRDFYPEDFRIREYIFNSIRSALKQFGYEEYDGPMLEPFELYASKSSEEIVNEQLYSLIDRGERKLAIRPEMTPTLARMVAAKQQELPKPIRWFSIPNVWRYERPQRGRLREHWQLNVDTLGGQPLQQDVEMCQIIVAIFKAFKVQDGFIVKLNHRGLTDCLFKEFLKLDSTESFTAVGRVLDAAPKMSAEQIEQALSKLLLTPEQIKCFFQILNQDKNIHSFLENREESAHLTTLMTALNKLNIAQHFRYDPTIMRGFTYYTGIVFEVFDTHPDNNRALFGGGRYDDLVGLFGGEKLSGVGFGMGDVTIAQFLETRALLPSSNFNDAIYFSYMDENLYTDFLILTNKLRIQFNNTKLSTALLTSQAAEKSKKAFAQAEKLKCRYLTIIGSNEIATQTITIKDRQTQSSESISCTQLIDYLKRHTAPEQSPQ